MKLWKPVCMAAIGGVALSAACGGKEDGPSTPTPVVTLTAPSLESPADGTQTDTLRPTLTVRNVSSQTGARTYEFQIADSQSFAASTTSIVGFAATAGKTGIPEGTNGTTSYTPDSDLQPTTLFYWRARALQGNSTSPWSATGRFKSRLVGFSKAGELYDPLIHGETVGELVGSTTFVPGRGVQLNTTTSYVKYLLPQTITNGEFSMDVEGLAANAPGDKAKVFAMQEGQGNFITNRYRVDIQYRGSAGFPPNAITFRALYGGDDQGRKYEPDTAKRMASVYLLNPSTVYYWKAIWGTEFRLTVKEGGLNGSTLYDYGMPTPNGTYAPNPHYVYLGAPIGTSGTESASIAGTVYRNVWIGNRPRPESLGTALLALQAASAR